MEVSKFGCEGDECTCNECQRPLPGLEPTPEPVQEALPGLSIPLYPPKLAQYTRVRTFVFEDGEFLCKCSTEEAAERVLNAMSAAAANDYNVRLLAQLR